MVVDQEHQSMAISKGHTVVSETEKTLNFALEAISEGLWDWDLRNNKVNRSVGWYRMLGYPADSLPQTIDVWKQAIHPDDKNRVEKILDAYMNGESDQYQAIYRCRKQDGGYLWVQDTGRYVEFDEAESPVRMIGVQTNIDDMYTTRQELSRQSKALSELNADVERLVEKRTAELRELNEQLRLELKEASRMALSDELTGIASRRRFEDLLHQEIRRVQRSRSPTSLLMLSVDGFTLINQTYGYQSGDETLIQVSQSIKTGLRQIDSFGRWQTDVFGVLLPDSNLQQAIVVAHRIRERINQIDHEQGLKITVSIGLTQYIPDEDARDFIHRADDYMLLSQAKKDSITSSSSQTKTP